MVIRTLVVGEVRFLREALARALSLGRDLEVLAPVPAARAVAAVEEQQPDVTLLHLEVPEGPELARALSLSRPHHATLALGMSEDDATIVAWAEAGVGGYVPRHMALPELVVCVRMVADGGAACPPSTAAILLRQMARAGGPLTDPRLLTARESEIAELVSAGLSNKEIARALSISLPTVKNHVHHILGKLEVDRRQQVGPELRVAAQRRPGPD